MGVAIVTDSTAYLTPGQVAAAGAPLRVVPLHVVIGGQEHREGVDVRVEDLAEALRRFVPVTTSRPAPAEFLQTYEELAAAGADASAAGAGAGSSFLPQATSAAAAAASEASRSAERLFRSIMGGSPCPGGKPGFYGGPRGRRWILRKIGL